MESLRGIGRRLRALWGRNRAARELDEEMRLHLALRRERLQGHALSPSEAAVAARRRFGDPGRLREEALDAWGWRWLDETTQDVRFAVRTLARRPAFTLMAICTLALGIGANTAVFSVVSTVVLQPLPFADPDRLVKVEGTSPLDSGGGPIRNVDTYRTRSRALDAMAGYDVAARYLRLGDARERVMTVRAEPDFFAILGVPPLHGRTFGRGDPSDVAVVSERFWRTHLGADPTVVGHSLVLDGRTVTVIGVMPASFQFPDRSASQMAGVVAEERTDFWIPLDPPLGPRSQIGHVVARLRPGVSLAAAGSELTAIARQLEAEYPDTNTGRGARLVPLSDAVVSPAVRRPLLLLFGAVGLLLALACSNVATLVLVRLTLRSREVAVRRALGAGRLRLARQFLTESLLLSLAGGLAGLGLAWWGVTSIVRVAGAQIPRAHEVGLDWHVFAFVLAVCTIVGFALSLVSALAMGRREPRAALQASGGTSTMSPSARRLRDGLVIAEVALAFVLAVAAAVLVRELVRLKRTDSGMVTANVITFHVGDLRAAARDTAVFYEIADRVGRLPGVRAAGFTQLLPLQNWGWTANSRTFHAVGREPGRDESPIELRFITPGYFRALGIPVRGRAFDARDTADAPPAIIINETLARQGFAGEDPIGQVTTRGTIVGIAGDVRQAHLDRPSQPELYTPIAQNWSHLSELGLTLVVATSDGAEAVVAPVRTVVGEIDPNLAVFRIRTMDAVVDESLASFTTYLSLIAVAATLALLLASTGTYATIAHLAATQTREFAIRVALGATRGRVVRVVVGKGARLTALGLAVGVLTSIAAGRLLQELPVSVRPPDAATLIPIGAVVAAIAVVACLGPARRAARVDPIDTLRSE